MTEIELVALVEHMSETVDAARMTYVRGSITHVLRVFDDDRVDVSDREIEIINAELARRFPEEEVFVERGDDSQRGVARRWLSGVPV